MQTPDDIFQEPKFSINHEQRLKLKVNKKEKLVELMTKIRKKTKYPIKDLAIYKLRSITGYGYYWNLIS
jgi:hypothetical protein